MWLLRASRPSLRCAVNREVSMGIFRISRRSALVHFYLLRRAAADRSLLIPPFPFRSRCCSLERLPLFLYSVLVRCAMHIGDG